MIDLVRPSRGHTTQFFAARQVDGNPHAGEDYAYSNSRGEIFPEVYAAAAGKVIFAGDARGLSWPNILYLNPDFNRADNVDESAGNYTIIEHYDAAGNVVAVTGYGHQEEIWVKAGQFVRPGQQIGVVGESGFSAGKHLHFDLVLNLGLVSQAPYYGRVDPKPYYTGSAALAPQGTITPTEEDDLMATPEQRKVLIDELFERLWDDGNGGQISLKAALGESRPGRKDVIRVAEGIPDKLLDTRIPRGGEMGGETTPRAIFSWTDQHTIDVMAVAAAAAANDGATVEEIKTAMKAAIDEADLLRADDVVKVDVSVQGYP